MAHTEVTLTVQIDPAREQALRLADQYVTEWSGQTKNERGHVHDKWQPVDFEKRAETVIRLATWLLERPAVLRSPPTAEPQPLVWPPEHRHRASCHGPAGEVVCGQQESP